jgi:hypothetical protein
MFNIDLSNKSYEMHNVSKDVLFDIDGFLYPFDPTWKRVGVNLSGGADSALGTSILCELIEKHNLDTEVFVITNVRVWNNRPWAAPISVEVYDKIRSMFPSVNMQRIQNFIPPEIEDGSIGLIEQLNTTGDRIATQSFNRFVTYTHKLEAIYNFITNNPTDDEFRHKSKPWDRTWNEEKLANTSVCPQFVPSRVPLLHPWKLVTKDFIIGEYIKRGWQDLLDTTRSCEGDKLIFPDSSFEDYETYIHGVSKLPLCSDVVDDPKKGCYWCAEREWAKKVAEEKLNVR